MTATESFYQINEDRFVIWPDQTVMKSGPYVHRDGQGYYYKAPLPKLNVDLMEECWKFAKASSKRRATGPRPLINIELPTGEVIPTRITWFQGNWAKVRQLKVKWKAKRNERGQFIGGQSQEFTCGTSFCLAGYAAQVTNNIAWGQLFEDYQPMLKDTIQTPEGPVRMDSQMDWYKGGALMMGLTLTESNRLFAATNQIGEIKRIMLDIAKARDQYIYLPD